MDYSKLTKTDIINGIKNNTIKFFELSEELKDDKDIVLEAIKKNGGALDCASERLRDDKDIVIEAVKNNGYALEYTTERLRDDKSVVIEAVKHNGVSLFYASKRLQNDKSVLVVLERRVSMLMEDGIDIVLFWPKDVQKWYQERMDILTNIREKELLESSIDKTSNMAKKIKF